MALTVLPVNDAPEAVGVIPDQALEAGDGPASPYFQDWDRDVLACAAVASDPVVTLSLAGATLSAHGGPPGRGDGDDDGAGSRRADDDAGVHGGDDGPAGARRRRGHAGREESRVTVVGMQVPLGADDAAEAGRARRSGHDRAGSLSLAFLDFAVQHLQGVLLTGSEGERPAGRFPAVHRRRGYAEQAGELGDRESAPAAQLRHPAARRLEPGRRGAGPLPSGRRAAVRRVEIDAEDVREIAGEDRRPPPRRPATPCRRRPSLRRRRPAGGRAARDARRAGCRRRRARRPRACTSPPSRDSRK